jgi:hypothetical protein
MHLLTSQSTILFKQFSAGRWAQAARTHARAAKAQKVVVALLLNQESILIT